MTVKTVVVATPSYRRHNHTASQIRNTSGMNTRAAMPEPGQPSFSAGATRSQAMVASQTEAARTSNASARDRFTQTSVSQ